MSKKVFTDEDINNIISLRAEGYTFSEISELTGFNTDSMRAKLATLRQKGWDIPLGKPGGIFGKTKNNKQEPKKEEPQEKPKEKPKEKTLYDFSPREILYHLFHNLGYKIDENGLYKEEIVKNRVKLTDLL